MITLELDCPTVLSVPLHALVIDIILAYGIANIIFLAAFIGLVFFLFRGKEFIYPLLACNLLCIPYSIGMLDYFNMMFFSGAFYVIRVAMPIFLVALLLCAFSSGVYVLFVGVVPILATYILYKVLTGEKAPWSSCIVFGLCTLSSVKSLSC